MRATRGDVDGRGISVAITNVESGHLWFEDAIKDVTGNAVSGRPELREEDVPLLFLPGSSNIVVNAGAENGWSGSPINLSRPQSGIGDRPPSARFPAVVLAPIT